MRIATSGKTAFVTFTSATACGAYYDSYPNGLDFRYRDKKYVVMVEKSDKVDVVSGVLENYLACGATRVVRATGADGEWTMRALYRLAAGDKAQRYVEKVMDTYHDEVRTVIFRFGNIADAVAFRGVLLRDEEWVEASVDFTKDPCEEAKGVHLE